MQTLRYDDLGSINAVKILPTIESYNGYILLHTELDSHIEEGDNIFITYSGDINSYPDGDIILDNFMYSKKSIDRIYSTFTTGYKVIYVNKNINTFAINKKISTIQPNKDLVDHYVSSISINNGNIIKSEINSTIFKNINIVGPDIIWKQGVVLDGDITDVILLNKYPANYISLNLSYDTTYLKTITLNNNTYGYSYFYNLSASITDCEIDSGIFNNCKITSTTSNKKINNGYFEDCNIINIDIYNGYFKDLSLESSCNWYYGKWDSIHPFNIIWNDGSFITGTFNGSEWKDGIFVNGTFEQNNIWYNGTFLNGIFNGSEWKHGIFNGGLLSGLTQAILVDNIDMNGGLLANTIIKTSNLKDGNITNSIIKNSIIDGIIIEYSTLFNNEYVSGLIDTSKISDSIINSKIFITNSEFLYNNNIKNGNIISNLFNNKVIIENGIFSNNIFDMNTNKTGQKCKIISKKLFDSSSTLQDIMYVELLDGHYFTENDINTSNNFILSGFGISSLNGASNISAISAYTNASKFDGSDYEVFPSTGATYILLDKAFMGEYYGLEGFIYIDNLDSNLLDKKHIINNGEFSGDEFKNSTINNGKFRNVNMHNNVVFNNGYFYGGSFSTTSSESANTWNDGQFFNGLFGDSPQNNNIFAIIDNTDTDIISDSNSSTTNITIESIYPRLFGNGAIEPASLSSTTISIYSPWDDVGTTISLPYQIVFKINTDGNKDRIISWLNLSTDINLVDLDKNENNPIGGDGYIFKDFNSLYDNGYVLKTQNGKKYYDYGEINYVYIIFESEKVKNLYQQSIGNESNSYDINYKNTWSVANTGYYTHPLPVLETSNTSGVTTYISGGTETEWIYGTAVPPWWLYSTYTIVSIFQTTTTRNINISNDRYNTPDEFNFNEVDSYYFDMNTSIDPLLISDTLNYHTKYINMQNSNYNTPYNKTFFDWMNYYTFYRNNMGDTSFGYSGPLLESNILNTDMSSWGNDTGWTFSDNIITTPEDNDITGGENIE